MASTGPQVPKQDVDDVDMDTDLDHNDDELANELFDAVLSGSMDEKKEAITKVAPTEVTQTKAKATKSVAKKDTGGKPTRPKPKLSIYVGNFPWWISDVDLIFMAQQLGVKDVTDVKFAESKVNGQSRGYAEMTVKSQESLKTLLDKVPECKLNGENLNCRFATHHNISVFEDVANSRMPQRVQCKDTKESESSCGPSFFSPEPVPPPPAFRSPFPPLPNPYLAQAPPHLFPHFPPNIPPPPLPPPLFSPPPPIHNPCQPSSALPLNPPTVSAGNDGQSSEAYNQSLKIPEADFEELMMRNKAVASTAITKAMSGATSGNMQTAMETLLAAIAIIKQSRAYQDERCQALVTSLKDCLVSINENSSPRVDSRSREEERDRGRDRERRRDRDREDSFDRECAGKSRRRRDRSWSGDRERERHRYHRDRYH